MFYSAACTLLVGNHNFIIPPAASMSTLLLRSHSNFSWNLGDDSTIPACTCRLATLVRSAWLIYGATFFVSSYKLLYLHYAQSYPTLVFLGILPHLNLVVMMFPELVANCHRRCLYCTPRYLHSSLLILSSPLLVSEIFEPSFKFTINIYPWSPLSIVHSQSFLLSSQNQLFSIHSLLQFRVIWWTRSTMSSLYANLRYSSQ